MSALYTVDLLRLAAATIDHPRLIAPNATVDRRSPTCGSRIITDVQVDAYGRILAYGHDVRACALGQAAATLFARAVVGRDAAAIAAAASALAAWLHGDRDDPGDWPGLDQLAAARAYPARHASIQLAFAATTDAVQQAIAGRRAATGQQAQ